MRHTRTGSTTKFLRLTALAAAVAGLGALNASAATETWVGNTDTNWGTAANWDTLIIPAGGDSLIFGIAGTAGTTLNNDLTGLAINTLTFNSSASGYTLGGNAFTLQGNLTNNSTSVQLLNNAITMAASQTVTGSGTTVLAGQITGVTGTFTKSGTGTVTLSGANSLTLANISVSGGLLRLTNGIYNANSTGGNTQLSNNGNIEVSGGASLNITNTAGGGFFPIASTAGQTATFLVSGGNVTVNNNFGTEVGQVGTGVLTINNGGTFSSNDTGNIGFKVGENGGAKGTVNLDGGTLSINLMATSLSATGGGTVYFNGGVVSPLFNNTGWWNATTVRSDQVRNGGAIFDTNGFAVTIAQGLVHSTVVGDNAIDGGLTKRGAGTLTLTGASAYTGPTIVSGGKLNFAGGSVASASIDVNGGGLIQSAGSNTTPVNLINGSVEGSAIIDKVTVSNNVANVISNTPGATLTINNLTFSGAASLNLNVSSPTTAELSAGTITTNAANNITVNPSNFSWSSAAYTLINYTTLAGGGNKFVLGTVANLSPRQTATLTNSGNSLILNVVGENPRWTGETTTNWNGTGNWRLLGSNNLTTFMPSDVVLFDDSSTNQAVTIEGANVSPLLVTFSNNETAYNVSGPFGIAGTGRVIINGTGLVALSAPSTYSGGTFLNTGVLAVNGPSAIGTGTLTIAAATSIGNMSGAPVTLTTNNAQAWNGDFSFFGPDNLDMGTGPVTLAGNRLLTVDNATLSIGGTISGAFNLTKIGSGTLRLYGNNTYSAGTLVDNGTLEIAGGSTGTTATTSDFQISPTGTGTGNVIVSGGILNANRVIVAGATANNGTPGSGNLTQTGGTINSNAAFTVGSGTTAGTGIMGNYTLTNGVLIVRATGLQVANLANASGNISMSGGSINLYSNISLAMGAGANAGSGTVTQSGGLVTFYSNTGTTIGGTGALNMGSNGTLPAGSNYVYNLNGGTLTVPTITANAGANNLSTSILNLNGGVLRAATNNANWINTIKQVNIQSGGAFINTNGLTVGTALPLNGTGALTKSGTGTLNLSGASGYTGATSVTAGTLVVSGAGSINASPSVTLTGNSRFANISSVPVTTPVTVTSGGVDGTGTFNSVTVASAAANFVNNGNGGGGTSPLTINNLTLSGAATLNLFLNSTSPGVITSSLTASGAAGSVVVNANSPTWTSGQTYNLVSYSTLGGTGFSAFALGTLGGLTSRQSATFVNTGSALGVQIAGGDVPVWTGGANANWTTAAVAAPKNWVLQTGGTATDFIASDIVLFNDTATGPTDVVISDASVAPTAVTFNNSTKNYSVSSPGGFGITSGFLVKSGTGSLTINTVNSYTGGTTFNDGTLILNSNSAIGTGTLTMNSGTLILNHSNATSTAPIVINGGTLNSTGAADIVSASTARLFLNGDITFLGTRNLSLGTGSVTLGGAGTARTINVAAGRLSIGSIPVATGFDLNKTGAGTLTINASATSNLSGLLNVAQGTFQIGNADFVAAGLTGTGAINNGSGTSRNLTVNGAATNTTFSGTINPGGAGLVNLVKNGAGSLTLTGTGASSVGAVTVNAGLLNMANTNTTVTGTVAVTGGSLILSSAATSASTGNLTMSNAGSFKMTAGAITFAGGGAMNNTSSVEVTGGTLTIGNTAGGFFPIGATAGQTATMLVNGGNVVVSNNFGTEVGQVGNGVLTINSGSYTSTDTANIGLKIGENAGTNGIVNLNGGTLAVNGIALGGSSATGGGKLYFNGGTLKALQTRTNFFTVANTPNVSAEVRNGGAVVDTAGFDITIGRPLIHSTVSGDNAIDGGLTKNGAGVLTMGGSLTYTGPTKINAGSLILNAPVNNIGSIQGTSLTLGAATNVVTAASSGTSKLDSLTLSGGTGSWTSKLDLVNNSLIVTAPDAATQATVLATLQDQLTSGKAGGLWNGNGITASAMTDSAFAAVNQVVLADVGDLGVTSLRGQTVDANSTILSVAHNGDATLDGKVDAFDLNRLAANWQKTGQTWITGDFTGDGKVDAFDLNALAAQWQFGVGGSLEAALASFPEFSGAASAVPEPASLAVLALGGAALLGRRRRKA